LQTLNLAHNGITDVGAKALLKAVESNHFLLSLK
jgi:hypothetical protein